MTLTERCQMTPNRSTDADYFQLPAWHLKRTALTPKGWWVVQRLPKVKQQQQTIRNFKRGPLPMNIPVLKLRNCYALLVYAACTLVFAVNGYGQQILLQTNAAQDGQIYITNYVDYTPVDFLLVREDTTYCAGILEPLETVTCSVNGSQWAVLYSTDNIAQAWIIFSDNYFFAEPPAYFGYTEANINLGIAVFNYSSLPQTVYLWVLDRSFNGLVLLPVEMPPYGYLVGFVHEFFPELVWTEAMNYYIDVYSDLNNPTQIGLLAANCVENVCNQIFMYPQW